MAAISVCLLIVAVMSTSIVAELCPDGWKHYNGQCYKSPGYVPLVNYQTAVDMCASEGAVVAGPRSDQENTWLREYIGNFGQWLNMKYDVTSSTFVWQDTLEHVTWANWAPGRGSASSGEAAPCVGMHVAVWYDNQDCDAVIGSYTCVKSAAVETTTTTATTTTTPEKTTTPTAPETATPTTTTTSTPETTTTTTTETTTTIPSETETPPATTAPQTTPDTCSVTWTSDFLDCPGHTPLWPWEFSTRRCCDSPELPNNCECFDISLRSKFTNSQWRTPKCPCDIRAVFTLFNAQSQTGSVISSSDLSNFNADLKTFFIVHGYMSSADVHWVIDIKNAILEMGSSNVVLVDWRHGADDDFYPQAVATTRTVAAITSRLIQEMLGIGAKVDDMHLIGHGLGAHISGIAGQEVKRLTGQLIGRISGLDPAGQSYKDAPDVVLLDHTDAVFVDVIHTHAGESGMSRATGDADYWVNDGKKQPGCPVLTGAPRHAARDVAMACSHDRAHQLFRQSVHGPCDFLSSSDSHVTCPLGYHARSDCRGNFQLNTTAAPPFC